MRNDGTSVLSGQPGETRVDVHRQDAPESPHEGSWRVRTPVSFLDARTTHRLGDKKTPISVRERLMLAILDGYCRNKPYCWMRNEELAAAYGCEERTAQEILKEMEDDGLIYRVPSESGKRGRIGIVMRKRVDPNWPSCGTDQALRMAIVSLKEQRESTRKTAPTRARKTAPTRARKTAPELESFSLKKDEPEKDERPEGQIPPVQRQRPEPEPVPQSLTVSGVGKPLPTAEDLIAEQQESRRRQLAALAERRASTAPPPSPCSSTPAPPPTAEAGQVGADPPLDPATLTDGMLAFLATLAAGPRAAFDALPTERRRQLLEPHRLGCDRIMATEAAMILRPKIPAAPPPSVPGTTAELWEQLPGAPPHWAQLAAEAMVRDFGTDKDRRLWAGFNVVADAVWKGGFPASAVLDAYRQAMKPESKNRGAVFNTALKRNGWAWEG